MDMLEQIEELDTRIDLGLSTGRVIRRFEAGEDPGEKKEAIYIIDTSSLLVEPAMLQRCAFLEANYLLKEGLISKVALLTQAGIQEIDVRDYSSLTRIANPDSETYQEDVLSPIPGMHTIILCTDQMLFELDDESYEVWQEMYLEREGFTPRFILRCFDGVDALECFEVVHGFDTDAMVEALEA